MDLLKNLKKRGGKKDTRDSSNTTYVTTIITKRFENGDLVEESTNTYKTNVPVEVSVIPTTKPVDNPIEEHDPDENHVKIIEERDPDEKPVKIIEKYEKPVKKIEERDPDEPEIDDSIIGHKGERSDPASRCSPIVDGDEFEKHLDLTDHDFSRVDGYARATPRAETESISRLSEYLIKPWSNDLDKLRCIFTWITDNIRYDTDAFFGGNIQHCGPEEVLKTRKAVCDGYAELFDRLSSQADLKVWKISGHAKGVGFTAESDIESRQFAHAWNGVLYKGELLLVDSTWGAGILNGPDFEKHFQPFYFLCSPTQFIYSHFPKNPEQQYLEPKLAKKEFLDLPYVKPNFFTSGLGFVKHHGNIIEVSDDKFSMEIERTHPDESKPIHATLEWKGKELAVLIQRLETPGPRGGRKYKLTFNCPSKGEGKFNIYVMLKGNEGPMVSSFKIKNSGSGKNYAPFVNTYSVPFSFTIQSPVYAKLNFNEDVRFEITVFDLPESDLPSFALFLPDKSTIDLRRVSSTRDSHTYAIETRADKRDKWNLTYCTQPNTFNFIAQYVVE